MNKMKTKEIVFCALFVALTAVGAFIQVPVPGMDYFTLQFFFVLMAGLLLGSKLGGIAVLAYVLIGLAGVPIFAAGGGIAYIFRPSFGYLIGFVVAAFLCGLVAEKVKTKSFKTYLLACFVGFVACYGIGLVYKYFMLNFYVGETTAFIMVIADCFPLDMPGDIILCVISALVATRLRPVAKKYIFD